MYQLFISLPYDELQIDYTACGGAGALAALSIRKRKAVREVSVRDVQEVLLKGGARLQPYLDLEPSSPDFLVLQRIGSTGIMRGKGETIGWSNEMRFRISKPPA